MVKLMIVSGIIKPKILPFALLIFASKSIRQSLSVLRIAAQCLIVLWQRSGVHLSRNALVDKLDCLAYYINMTWQLQDAKNRFSEVVETSLSKGPQVISRRGKNTAVLLSYGEYQKLTQKRKSVKQALMAMDISQLDLTRDPSDTGRAAPIEFGHETR